MPFFQLKGTRLFNTRIYAGFGLAAQIFGNGGE
jgi:hypothetical protein